MTLLDKVKRAVRAKSDVYNDELTDLIEAAKLDLSVPGITYDAMDALVEHAIITYCKLNFGQPEDYDRLERSYNAQKAQLSMDGRYAPWREQYAET